MARLPLGDRLVDLLVLVFVASWAIGWVVLLLIIALQYVLPTRASTLERILQFTGRTLDPILKYAGMAALVLLALRLFAGWYR